MKGRRCSDNTAPLPLQERPLTALLGLRALNKALRFALEGEEKTFRKTLSHLSSALRACPALTALSGDLVGRPPFTPYPLYIHYTPLFDACQVFVGWAESSLFPRLIHLAYSLLFSRDTPAHRFLPDFERFSNSSCWALRYPSSNPRM